MAISHELFLRGTLLAQKTSCKLLRPGKIPIEAANIPTPAMSAADREQILKLLSAMHHSMHTLLAYTMQLQQTRVRVFKAPLVVQLEHRCRSQEGFHLLKGSLACWCPAPACTLTYNTSAVAERLQLLDTHDSD